jgi:hypothetical protein
MKQYELRRGGKRFAGHKSANAQVITDNGTFTLISYAKTVAELDSDGWLKVYGLFSQTTTKHINWFCEEYCKNREGIYPTKGTAKMCANNHMRYNIHTGEIQEC